MTSHRREERIFPRAFSCAHRVEDLERHVRIVDNLSKLDEQINGTRAWQNTTIEDRRHFAWNDVRLFLSFEARHVDGVEHRRSHGRIFEELSHHELSHEHRTTKHESLHTSGLLTNTSRELVQRWMNNGIRIALHEPVD